MTSLITAGAARIAASALALCLALAGCGGHAGGPSVASPAHRAGGQRSSAAHACAAQAAGDPASLQECLAGHGIVIPAGGRLTGCVESAS